MTCDLGAMDVGEISEVHIVVTVSQEEGVVTNLASVSADELDINLTDNSEQVDTPILVYLYLAYIAR